MIVHIKYHKQSSLASLLPLEALVKSCNIKFLCGELVSRPLTFIDKGTLPMELVLFAPTGGNWKSEIVM
jgi:hypothetical protein